MPQVRVIVEDSMVVIDGEGRTVDLSGLVDATKIISIGWEDDGRGRVIYTKAERVARAALVAGGSKDRADTAISEMGQDDFTDPSVYDDIVNAWTAVGPTPDLLPSIQPLQAVELAALLVSKGIMAQQEIDDIIAARIPAIIP